MSGKLLSPTPRKEIVARSIGDFVSARCRSSFGPREKHSVKTVGTGAIVQSRSRTGRQIQIFGGQFRFELDETPLIGLPEAPHVIVCLLDYTCFACRVMHGHLIEAHKAFSNELAS
jgi:hypothetical protein